MKKFAATLTALVCALALCFGLAACDLGGGTNGGGTDDPEQPAPKNEVTEAEWKNIFTTTKNFTMTVKLPYDGQEVAAYCKVDGINVSLLNPNGTQVVYVEEGESYYRYSQDTDGQWERETSSPDTDAVKYSGVLYLALLKDSFAQFTFSDGAYTCASLKVNLSMFGEKFGEEGIDVIDVKNARVVFEDGALTGLSYTVYINGIEEICTFSDFGATKIDIPTDYTEK